MSESNQNPAERFIIRHKGKRIGPLAEDQVQRMFDRGQITSQHEITLAGTTDWQRISQWRTRGVPAAEEASPQPVVTTPDVAQKIPGESPNRGTAGDWYVAIDEQQYGPMDEPAIGVLIREGRIVHDTPIWRNGMEAWSSAGEVFPAVLAASVGGSSATVKGPDLAFQNGRSRNIVDRHGWVLTLCVFTYVFAIEMLAGAIFLIHTAVVVRRSDAVTTFSIASVVALIVTVILLTAAIHMTRLVAAIDRSRRADSPQYAHEVALHERRVWVTGVWLGTIILLCQAAMLLMILVGTARIT